MTTETHRAHAEVWDSLTHADNLGAIKAALNVADYALHGLLTTVEPAEQKALHEAWRHVDLAKQAMAKVSG